MILQESNRKSINVQGTSHTSVFTVQWPPTIQLFMLSYRQTRFTQTIPKAFWDLKVFRNTYLFPLLRPSSLLSSISSVVTWIPLRAGHNDNTGKHRVGPYLEVCLLKLRNVVKFTVVIRDLEKSSLSPRVLLHLNWHLLSRQNSKLKFAQLVWSTFTFILKVKILHNFNSGLNASNRPNR